MSNEAPASVLDLASACVRYVQKSVGIELDYTPETLPLLDHYLRELGAPVTSEITALIAPAAGAYFGEVLRRNMGPVRWHTEGQSYTDYRLEFERCFLYFNPVGQALEAIMGEAVAEYGAHLGLRPGDGPVVEATLQRLGQVRDEDFYRLSTRYEVIEAVVVALIGQMLGSSESDRHFTAEEYLEVVQAVTDAKARGGRPN